MHKVKELEDKWFNYKIKKIILPMLKVSVLYVVVAGGYYLYNKEDSLFSLLPLNRISTNVLGVSIEVNDTIEDKNNTVLKEKGEAEKEVIEKMTLVPIIPVIDMEKEERISELKRHKPVKIAHTVAAKRNNYLTAKELAVITKNQRKDEVTTRKTKKINFTSTSTNYLTTMKHKFSKSNSPRDALLVAKAYYKDAQYVEAETWALSANKLNSSLEDSWLLFAKSKAKLGKKKEALQILVSYYTKSHSLKAKRLIRQIETGKI